MAFPAQPSRRNRIRFELIGVSETHRKYIQKKLRGLNPLFNQEKADPTYRYNYNRFVSHLRQNFTYEGSSEEATQKRCSPRDMALDTNWLGGIPETYIQPSNEELVWTLNRRKARLSDGNPDTIQTIQCFTRIYYAVNDPAGAYKVWWPYLAEERVVAQRKTAGGIFLKENKGNWRLWPDQVQALPVGTNLVYLVRGILWLRILAEWHIFHGRHLEAATLLLQAWCLRNTFLDGYERALAHIENQLISLYNNTGRQDDAIAIRNNLLGHSEEVPTMLQPAPLLGSVSFQYTDTTTSFSRKLGLPGFINRSECAALADTGSDLNMISHRLALKMNLRIWPTFNTFVMGNSRVIHSVGYTEVAWAYRKDTTQTKHSLVLHVLPACTFDLILGDRFLEETRALTANRHLLETCSFQRNKKLSLSLINPPKRRLKGFLQRNWSDKAREVSAIPDTGAEANFMSESLALKHGFAILGSRNFAQFVDGSEEATLGHVELFWTFSNKECGHKNTPPAQSLAIEEPWPKKSSMPFKLIFHILKECRGDIILGQELLHSADLFNQFSHYLQRVDSARTEYDLLPFGFRKGRKRNPKHSVKFDVLTPELEDDAKELERQSQWDEEVRPTATEEQIRLEEQKRTAYEQRRKDNLTRTT